MGMKLVCSDDTGAGAELLPGRFPCTRVTITFVVLVLAIIKNL